LHAEHDASFVEARALISRVKEAERVVEVHRTTRPRRPSNEIARLVIAILEPAALG
jgi:hypothetical protein